jgi:hypothetical protein
MTNLALCINCGRQWIWDFCNEQFLYKNGNPVEKIIFNPVGEPRIENACVYICACKKANAVDIMCDYGVVNMNPEEWEGVDWEDEENCSIDNLNSFLSVYDAAKLKYQKDEEDFPVCTPIDPVVRRSNNGEWTLESQLNPPGDCDFQITLSEFDAWFWETYSQDFVPDNEDVDEFMSAHPTCKIAVE